MSDPDTPPVLLVGAGPAGISTALWLHNFGVPFDWVDARATVGGMLAQVHNEIDNYPGGHYDDGPSLQKSLSKHLDRLELSPHRCEITSLRVDNEQAIAIASTGLAYRPDRLVLATGTKYRQLDVPGESAGLGSWISQSAAADAAKFRGRPVAVVGGGDAAFENALLLAEVECSVTLVVRNPRFRARPAFVSAVREHPSIEIAPIPSIVEAVETTAGGGRIHLCQAGKKTVLDVAGLFIRIGVDPVLPEGCDFLERDQRGYLQVSASGQTSFPAIYAAGDITSCTLRSIATAVGGGARVAHTCAEDLGHL